MRGDLQGGQLPVEVTALQHGRLFLTEYLIEFVHLLNVHLRGVDLARGRPVHVPEGPLLTVQDLPLLLISLLCHLDQTKNYQP